MNAPPGSPTWSASAGIALRNAADSRTTASELCALALRRNPRRAQLIVSTVLAKHLPTPGHDADAYGAALAAQIRASYADILKPNRGPITVIGLAETATALAAIVATNLPGSHLLTTTRDLSDSPRVLVSFQEPHSHATTHHILDGADRLLHSPGTVIVVDDEISHGTTLANLLAVLRAHYPRNTYLGASLIDAQTFTSPDSGPSDAPPAARAVPTVSLTEVRMEVSPDATTWVAEHRDTFTTPIDASGLPGRWTDLGLVAGSLPDPRHGISRWTPKAMAPLITRARAEHCSHQWGRTLIIGVEEFMYPAIAVAAALGADAQSSTRSPIVIWDRADYPLRAGYTFPSLYDPQVPAYLYRPVPHNHPHCYDDVLVLFPTAPGRAFASPGLMKAATAFGTRVWLLHVPMMAS